MRAFPIFLTMIAFIFSSYAVASYTLNAPASSSGSYTVTWSNTSGSYYTLQERRDGGNWQDVLTSTTVTSKAFTKAVTGIYDYRIEHRIPCYYYCYNGSYNLYHSSIDTTNVTVTNGALPSYPNNVGGPSNDNDGVFAITWEAPADIVDSYTVQQKVNGGSWYTIGSTDKTVMWMTGKSNGSYRYRVRSCNNNGCGSYSYYFNYQGSVTVSINASAPVSITYKYDELGRLVSVIDSKSGSSEFTYDDAGNRVEVTTNNDTGKQN